MQARSAIWLLSVDYIYPVACVRSVPEVAIGHSGPDKVKACPILLLSAIVHKHYYKNDFKDSFLFCLHMWLEMATYHRD